MFHQVDVPAGPVPELTSDRLWQAGALGVEEWGDRLRAGFADPATAELLAADLGGTASVTDEDAGLDEARRHGEPHRAGPFRIRAPWHLVGVGTDGIDVVIDPGHAFGAGSHASTRLALELLARRVSPGMRVADLGCGSGVLAIAAAIQGATGVLAVDTDTRAIAATQANLAHNKTAGIVRVEAGSTDSIAGRWDVLLVNVTVDIHEAVGPGIVTNVVSPVVIATGILAGPQEARVAASYRRPVLDRRTEGDWVGLVLGDFEPARPNP